MYLSSIKHAMFYFEIDYKNQNVIIFGSTCGSKVMNLDHHVNVVEVRYLFLLFYDLVWYLLTLSVMGYLTVIISWGGS